MPIRSEGGEAPEPWCVSHHNACDCREWRINQMTKQKNKEIARLRADNERLRRAIKISQDTGQPAPECFE